MLDLLKRGLSHLIGYFAWFYFTSSLKRKSCKAGVVLLGDLAAISRQVLFYATLG